MTAAAWWQGAWRCTQPQVELAALMTGAAAARWGWDRSRGDNVGSGGHSRSSHALRACRVMHILLFNPHNNPTRGRIIIPILQMKTSRLRSLQARRRQSLDSHSGWWASLVVRCLRIHLPMQGTWVRSLGREDPLKKGMATHTSVLAWRIPWTEEPGGLWFIGSHRVGHD